jgi:hypothetical protein
MKFTQNLSVADYHDLITRMLRVFEGEYLRPYVDPVGIITIGIGINIEDVRDNLNDVLEKGTLPFSGRRIGRKGDASLFG